MPLETGASIATRLTRSGESMKVRILRDGAFKVGDVVDLHDSVAGAWIKSGLAEHLEGQERKAPKEFIPLNKRKKV